MTSLGRKRTNQNPVSELPIALLDVLNDQSAQDEYQRPLQKSRVAEYAANFDRDLCLPIVVSPLSTGRYAVLDGQHRMAAMQALGFTSILAVVVPNRDRKAQASLFTDYQNKSQRASGSAMHKAAVAAGDPVGLTVERVKALYPRTRITRAAAYLLAETKARVPGALEHEQLLKTVTQTLHEAFPGVTSPNATLVRGLGIMYAHHPTMKKDTMVAALEQRGYYAVESDFRKLYAKLGIDRDKRGAYIYPMLVNLYNKQRGPKLKVIAIHFHDTALGPLKG